MTLVTVRALRPFKEALGAGELSVERPDGETLEGLVRALAEAYPAFAEHALDEGGGVALTLGIMVGGRPVGEGSLAEELEEGQEVLLFLPMSGG